MNYGEQLKYEMEVGQRLASMGEVSQGEIEAERAVLFRQRLEGGG